MISNQCFNDKAGTTDMECYSVSVSGKEESIKFCWVDRQTGSHIFISYKPGPQGLSIIQCLCPGHQRLLTAGVDFVGGEEHPAGSSE